jgi:hypothetical protein
VQVNARILFVDPSTRAVGLTLNKHLLHLKMPPTVSFLVQRNNSFDKFLDLALFHCYFSNHFYVLLIFF